MSIIEANIIIDAKEGVDVSQILAQVEAILQEINNKPTSINVIDADDPITTNPLNYRVGA